MIIAIEGIPDVSVKLLNERLLEIFGTEKGATDFMRTPAANLAIAALKHGHALQIIRNGGETFACLRKLPPQGELPLGGS